jgi:uncharacterized protein involved in exopolysaccharide biosynthesis
MSGLRSLLPVGIAGLLGGCLMLAYTQWVTPEYAVEAALASKSGGSSSLLANLPIPAAGGGGNSVLNGLNGILSSTTAEYYIFFATEEEWARLRSSKSDQDLKSTFNLPAEIAKGKNRRKGGIIPQKREDIQQLGIRATGPSVEEALVTASRAIEIADLLSDSSDAEAAKNTAKRLKVSIERVGRDLASIEKSLVQKGMNSGALASPTDFYAFRQKVDELRSEFRSVNAELGVVRAGAQQVASQRGKTPTGVAALDALRNQMTQTELQLKIADQTWGPGMPEVEKMRRELRATQQLYAKEIANYSRGIDSNMDPYLVQLRARAAGLSSRLADAVSMLDKMPTQTLSSMGLQREQRILEQTLTTLRVQYEQNVANAEAPTKDWVVLDQPHAIPMGRVEPTNKSYGKNGIIGGFVGSFLMFALLRIRKTIREEKSAVGE